MKIPVSVLFVQLYQHQLVSKVNPLYALILLLHFYQLVLKMEILSNDLDDPQVKL